MLNKHQDYIMDCIDYVKGLYKEAEEFKINLIQEVQKINNLVIKNDEEINEIRKQCKSGLDKINDKFLINILKF